MINKIPKNVKKMKNRPESRINSFDDISMQHADFVDDDEFRLAQLFAHVFCRRKLTFEFLRDVDWQTECAVSCSGRRH